jgi:hypothetical protein
MLGGFISATMHFPLSDMPLAVFPILVVAASVAVGGWLGLAVGAALRSNRSAVPGVERLARILNRVGV